MLDGLYGTPLPSTRSLLLAERRACCRPSHVLAYFSLPQDPASQLAQLVALEHLAGVTLADRVRAGCSFRFCGAACCHTLPMCMAALGACSCTPDCGLHLECTFHSPTHASPPCTTPPQVREVPLVLKALYDEDVVPEPLILAW